MEPVEIFRLVLEQVAGFTASNLSVAPNHPDGAIVQIDDDDGTMTVDVEPTGTLEILEEGGPVTLTVKAKTDHLVIEPFLTTVRVRTEDGTATLGNDFVSLGSGSQSRVDLYFVPGDFERTQESLPDNRRYAAEKTVTVTPIDDTLEEHPEDFKLTLSVIEATLTNIARTNLARTEVPIIILNDDVVVPVITVAADAASVTEGEDAVFTVTRSESVYLRRVRICIDRTCENSCAWT